MEKRVLILSVPVVHKGYIELFKKIRNDIEHIYIIPEQMVREFSEFKPDIASIDSETICKLLNFFGFKNISILEKKEIDVLAKKQVVFVKDDISRALHQKYFEQSDVLWMPVFLRWDRSSVLSTNPADEEVTGDIFDQDMIREAYKEAEKSGDWWRQVGSVLVKGREVILRAYNQGVPNDHSPYQAGAVRDFLKPGELPDLANFIHSEQKIIATAAKEGISLKGSTLYVTHFPCAVCAKLIAFSGIKYCYFGEGSSNLDGKAVLLSAGITLAKISLPE
jgi:dCMP deaminase